MTSPLLLDHMLSDSATTAAHEMHAAVNDAIAARKRGDIRAELAAILRADVAWNKLKAQEN